MIVSKNEAIKNSITKFLDKGILNCNKCKLCKYSVNVSHHKMLGFGHNGTIMVLGLCPSYNRSQIGGYAMSPGELLNSPADYLWRVINEVEFPVEKTYITNFLKCSTPQNREPLFEEATACFNNWLSQEIFTCSPRIIICLGKTAYEFMDQLNKFSVSLSLVEVYHHSYIARNNEKFEEWKKQWQEIKDIL